MKVIPGLYVVAIVATLMVSIRWSYEQYYVHTYKRAKAGHLCSRLARMGYISILDRKFLNYGWFVSQYLHTYGTASAIIEEYINKHKDVDSVLAILSRKSRLRFDFRSGDLLLPEGVSISLVKKFLRSYTEPERYYLYEVRRNINPLNTHSE